MPLSSKLIDTHKYNYVIPLSHFFVSYMLFIFAISVWLHNPNMSKRNAVAMQFYFIIFNYWEKCCDNEKRSFYNYIRISCNLCAGVLDNRKMQSHIHLLASLSQAILLNNMFRGIFVAWLWTCHRLFNMQIVQLSLSRKRCNHENLAPNNFFFFFF